MSIYYENGCFSLWSIDALDEMPKTAARKIARMIGKNMEREENEECTVIFADWICEKIAAASRAYAESHKSKDAEKVLKYYISLSAAAGFMQ